MGKKVEMAKKAHEKLQYFSWEEVKSDYIQRIKAFYLVNR
jgi:hypothetical protein